MKFSMHISPNKCLVCCFTHAAPNLESTNVQLCIFTQFNIHVNVCVTMLHGTHVDSHTELVYCLWFLTFCVLFIHMQWRVRNRDVFHLMCVIKRNCMRLEGRAFEHSQ